VSAPARLITVPFSHFCEKARWALDYTAAPYVEEGHLPLFHWRATARAGGGRTVPVLVADDGVFADSTDILRWADRRAPPDRRLLPDDPAARAACDALEDAFDEELGPATRRIGYWYAFADRRTVLALARRAGPAWQVALLRGTLPLVRRYLLTALAIDAGTVEESRALLLRFCDRIAATLRDGRRYLVGDRFTAADLTFAALAAPMVGPAEHPIAPLTADFPPPMHALWDELRAHPAGAFVLRLYAEHRGAPRTGPAAA
jgi:glutathione S-transferase